MFLSTGGVDSLRGHSDGKVNMFDESWSFLVDNSQIIYRVLESDLLSYNDDLDIFAVSVYFFTVLFAVCLWLTWVQFDHPLRVVRLYLCQVDVVPFLAIE